MQFGQSCGKFLAESPKSFANTRKVLENLTRVFFQKNIVTIFSREVDEVNVTAVMRRFPPEVGSFLAPSTKRSLKKIGKIIFLKASLERAKTRKTFSTKRPKKIRSHSDNIYFSKDETGLEISPRIFSMETWMQFQNCSDFFFAKNPNNLS